MSKPIKCGQHEPLTKGFQEFNIAMRDRTYYYMRYDCLCALAPTCRGAEP